MDIKLVRLLDEKNETISFMESCTGGYLAHTITNVEGASEVLKFSAVTYSNEFKEKMGVNKKTIDTYGVYSMEVAKEMSKVISDYANSTYGIGITGQLKSKDPNNNMDCIDKVFMSIYDNKRKVYHTKVITVDRHTRIANKDIVKNELIKYLYDYIINT